MKNIPTANTTKDIDIHIPGIRVKINLGFDLEAILSALLKNPIMLAHLLVFILFLAIIFKHFTIFNYTPKTLLLGHKNK